MISEHFTMELEQQAGFLNQLLSSVARTVMVNGELVRKNDCKWLISTRSINTIISKPSCCISSMASRLMDLRA